MGEAFDTTEIFRLEEMHMSGGMGRRPVAIVRGAGARLFDSEGREYIDMAAAQGWANLGHAHPEVTRAIQEQAARLVAHTESSYNDERAGWFADLAGVLRDEIGASEKGALTRIHPCNSGAEAVEAAIKAARYFTGRAGVVAAKQGFHGRTLGALSATWQPKYREPFLPLVPGFSHAAFNDIASFDEAVTKDTAAVIIEAVQGEGGVHPAKLEFLSSLHALCRERGALLILDEIQTGFGRTGLWFACRHFDLQPDMLVMGKTLGGGLPMGAVAWREAMGTLKSGLHASTFGGNPLVCAAGRAMLRVMHDASLPQRAARLGAWLFETLRAEAPKVVREVRGLGLMIGIVLRKKVQPVLKTLMDRGVWALPAGPTVLRLLPPLVILEEDLESATRVVLEVLREY